MCAKKEGTPCPGMTDPESLTPASLLIRDSKRSPNIDPAKFNTPYNNALVFN